MRIYIYARICGYLSRRSELLLRSFTRVLIVCVSGLLDLLSDLSALLTLLTRLRLFIANCCWIILCETLRTI